MSIKKGNATWNVSLPEDDKSPKKRKSKSKSVESVVDITKTPTLQNIDVNFLKGKLIGIIGPIGSGKSSLLQVLLRELPLDSGVLNVNGSVSYASQEPWVFAASVRQNILFGEDFDHEHYNVVTKCCALTQDFRQFENGDLTIVGEKGTLSGGQKARIKYVILKFQKKNCTNFKFCQIF